MSAGLNEAPTMVDISEQALSEFRDFLGTEENKGRAIRVVVAGHACSGPRLGLAWDDPIEEEIIFKDGDVAVLAHESIQDYIGANGGLDIEFVDDPQMGKGFKVAVKNQAACSSGCSC